MSGVTITTNPSGGDIITGDFNADGKTDLAVAIPWSNNFTVYPHVKTLHGNGDGTFTPVAYTSQMLISQNPHSLAKGDLNNDGRMDAVTTKSNGISALQSVPGGYLVQKGEYSTVNDGEDPNVSWTTGVAVGDFDDDGNLDAVASEYIHSRVIPFFGVGDGTLTRGTAIDISFGDDKSWTTGAGDLDHDGDDDIIIGMRDENGGADLPPMLILKSNGAARTFMEPVVHGTSSNVLELAVADVNGDGNLDVVSGRAFSIDVFLGNGDGTLGEARALAGAEAMGLVIADVDRDGGPDIIGTRNSPANVLVSLNMCGQVTIGMNTTANPANQGSTLTVTGTVVPPATATPSGTITLERGGSILGASDLATSLSIASSTNSLVPGNYEYKASYSGDSRFASSTATLLQVVQTPPFGPPPGLVANSFGGPVELTWIGTNGVDHYEIWRNSGAGFALIGSTAETHYTDNLAPASSALLYKVRGISPSTVASEFSPVDLALTMAFTDEVLAIGNTPCKSAHVTELRSAVNKVRAVAGLPPATFGDTGLVLASHVTELRTALDLARSALGLASVSYTDSSMTAGWTPIKAFHFLELRSAMR